MDKLEIYFEDRIGRMLGESEVKEMEIKINSLVLPWAAECVVVSFAEVKKTGRREEMGV